MTPKYKAKQLFNIFYEDPIGELSYIGAEEAKEFALIIPTEIIKTLSPYAGDDNTRKYWMEVIEEINKLK